MLPLASELNKQFISVVESRVGCYLFLHQLNKCKLNQNALKKRADTNNHSLARRQEHRVTMTTLHLGIWSQRRQDRCSAARCDGAALYPEPQRGPSPPLPLPQSEGTDEGLRPQEWRDERSSLGGERWEHLLLHGFTAAPAR